MARKRPVFTPWREDFVGAAMLGSAACYAAYRGLTAGTMRDTAIGLAIATVAGAVAHLAWRNGMARWYGKHLEEWAVARLGGQLDRRNIRWETGRWVPGYGDADLIAHASNGLVMVEIKSFQRWRHSLTAGASERDLAAYSQAAGTADMLGAVAAFIWLPRGRPTLMQRFIAPRKSGVMVVFGNDRVMYRRIKRFHKLRLLRGFSSRD